MNECQGKFLTNKQTKLIKLDVIFVSRLLLYLLFIYFLVSDINECLENPCGANAVCTNSPGSFLCSCKPDYTGNPYKGCTDIDECSALKNPCPPSAICENANPGYNCKCLDFKL